MNRYNRCPNCDSTNTEKVHTEQFTDMLEQVFVCNECPTQYTAKYDLFAREVDDVPMGG